MAPLRLRYPSTSASTSGEIVLRESLASLTNPQLTILQALHIAQGGRSFTFSPQSSTGAMAITRLLPVDITALPEADVDGRSGFTTLRTFLTTTLLGSQRSCSLTDPDGDSYTVKYVRGLETFQERPLRGRWSGTLLFREEP